MLIDTGPQAYADPRAGELDELVDAIRDVVGRHDSWADTSRLVAHELERHLPSPDVLTAEQRRGDPERYRAHVLHTEPGGSFSVLALVWRPGQTTPIHDHVTWCVFGVIQGVEHEELFDASLNLVGRHENHVGDVSGFAPPGDIHRVRNAGSRTAISIHVYGTDVSKLGSSVRREYDQPIVSAPAPAKPAPPLMPAPRPTALAA